MIGVACIRFECPVDCNYQIIEFGKCKKLKSGLCQMGKFDTVEELRKFLKNAEKEYIDIHFKEYTGLFANITGLLSLRECFNLLKFGNKEGVIKYEFIPDADVRKAIGHKKQKETKEKELEGKNG